MITLLISQMKLGFRNENDPNSNNHDNPTDFLGETWLEEWWPRYQGQVGAYECIQESGDLIYVPTDYMHMVTNLQPSVGVAVEVGHTVDLLTRLLNPVH